MQSDLERHILKTSCKPKPSVSTAVSQLLKHLWRWSHFYLAITWGITWLWGTNPRIQVTLPELLLDIIFLLLSDTEHRCNLGSQTHAHEVPQPFVSRLKLLNAAHFSRQNLPPARTRTRPQEWGWRVPIQRGSHLTLCRRDPPETELRLGFWCPGLFSSQWKHNR